MGPATCKILKNSWVNTLPSHTSENHQDTEKILGALDHLCPPGVVQEVDPDWMPPSAKNGFLNSAFDFLEFNVALESKNEGSAYGTDGIDYDVIKRITVKFKLILVDIFNEFYSTGCYPDDWNKLYIHFIKKADGVGVRPISLISCTCKIFETMANNRLQWLVEHEKILPSYQTGFRKGNSTTDSLVGLIISVEEAFSDGKGLLGAF